MTANEKDTISASPSSTLTVRMLGPFHIHPEPNHTTTLVRKSRAILAFLASNSTPTPRQTLTELFFSQTKDPNASLRWHLSRLRKAIGRQRCISNEGHIQLSSIQTDTDELEQLARIIHTKTEHGPNTNTIKQLKHCYQGPFLEDLETLDSPDFVFWLLGKRAHYERLYTNALEVVISNLEKRRQKTEALALTQELLKVDQASLFGHDMLLQLYVQTGQHSIAHKQHQNSLEILSEYLDEHMFDDTKQRFENILKTTTQKPHNTQHKEETLLPKQRDVEHLHISSSASRVQSNFVGRVAEQEQIRKAQRFAQAGQGQFILIEGEAGSGKTDFLQQVAKHSDLYHVQSCCFRSTQQRMYYPWGSLLQTIYNDFSLSNHLPFHHLRHTLHSLLPTHFPAQETHPLSKQQQTENLFYAVQTMLRYVASNKPLLLILDDLHWADDKSLILLQELGRWVLDEPIVLIGAYRPPPIASNSPIALCRQEHIRNHGYILQLPHFSAEETLQLIGQVWKTLPQEQHLDACQKIQHETNGHPLSVKALLDMLATKPSLPESFPFPTQLDAMMQCKWAELSEKSIPILEQLSVLELPFHWHTMRCLLHAPDGQMITAIEEGCKAGILKEKESSPPSFTWAHELMRQGALRRLSRLRQQLLHEQTAESLEQIETTPEVLAFHWAQAGNQPKQAYWLAEAGQKAIAEGKALKATKDLQQALTLHPNATNEGLWRLQLAKSLIMLGQWSEADQVLTHLLRQHPPKEQKEKAQFLKGKLLLETGDPHESLLQLEALLQEQDNQAHSCELLADLGTAHIGLANYDQAERYLTQAYNSLTPNTPIYTHAKIVEKLGLLADNQGHLERGHRYFDELLTLTDKAKPVIRLRALNNIGNHLAISNKYEEAKEVFTELKDTAKENDFHFLYIRACNGLGLVARYEEDMQEAFVNYAQVIEMGRQLNIVNSVWVAVYNMGESYQILEAVDEAMQCFTWLATTAHSLSNARQFLISLKHIALLLGTQPHTTQQAGTLFAQVSNFAEQLGLTRDHCFIAYEMAAYWTKQNEFKKAAPFHKLSQQIADTIDDNEIREIRLRLLSLQARKALHTNASAKTLAQLEAALCNDLESTHSMILKGEIFERLAQLTERQEQHDTAKQFRQKAVETYLVAYQKAPAHSLRERYKALTQQPLPPPPYQWPPPPAFLLQETKSVEQLTQLFSEWQHQLYNNASLQPEQSDDKRA